MKLEYFGIHGRAAMIRMALDYTGTEYEDNKLTPETFGANKQSGAYTWGQVPVMYLDDGT